MLRLRSPVALATLLLCAPIAGCAGGGGPDVDAGGTPGTDAGPPIERDGGPPVGDCEAGQHRCGSGCIDDLANEPANGCRVGCGEPCTVPPNGVGGCSPEGDCEFDCPAPFTRDGAACVCTPTTCEDMGFVCGAPDDGCGSPLDCGTCDSGSCIDGSCGCPDDGAEPNDTSSSQSGAQLAHLEASVSSWNMTFSEWNLHDADDVDWYRITIDDTGANNPVIEVTLRGTPTGSNYDLGAYWVCNDGESQSDCDSGAPDAALGTGCTSTATGTTSDTVIVAADCSGAGFNDSGAVYIRVTSADTGGWGGSCSNYTLEVDVEN